MQNKQQHFNKTSSNLMANTAFSDQFPAVFDVTSQGYLDMLGFQDYGGVSIFDLLQQPTSPAEEQHQHNHFLPSEMANTPTQNSSSVSCSSNEGVVNVDDQENHNRRSVDLVDDDEQHGDDDEEDQEKSTNATNKQ